MRNGCANWVRTVVLPTVLLIVAVACGDDEPETTATQPSTGLSGTLVFFAYEDSFLPDVLDPFREMHPDLAIETPAFADEDETETKLRAGFRADVVELCAGEVGDMVSGGLLAPIDTSRIDDWDLILPIFRDGLGTVDDTGNAYMVPLQGGASGLIYNTDMVAGGISSFEELFFGDWDGTIAVSNEPINTIGDMLLAHDRRNRRSA